MTQKEIAKQLNISQATVSMALKGSERISPAVRGYADWPPTSDTAPIRPGRCSGSGGAT